MFTKVIVPLDGHNEATASLPVARTLAEANGAGIALLRVVDRPAGLFASHANDVHEAAEYLEQVARDELGSHDLRLTTQVRSGDVVEAILGEADEPGSVVVMATRGHGGVVRAVLGSTASELLHRSPVPVVLLRADARPSVGLKTILAPVDGSPQSEQSLEAVVDLSRLTGAHVTLLQVVAPMSMSTWASQRAAAYEFGQYVDPAWDAAALTDARLYVDDLAWRLGMQGVAAEGLAVRGDVPRIITDTADGIGADLIVMRTRGHTGPARAVLGSVADAVVRSARTPVMLLRDNSGASKELATRARASATHR
jgi:nucleotide-binding universal stress UspA family protein